jgi:hypothetical protein
MPNSWFVVLPRQQHFAIDSASDLLAQELLTFLGEPGKILLSQFDQSLLAGINAEP